MNRIQLSIGLLFFVVLMLYINFISPEDEKVVSDDTPEAWDPNYQAKNMKSVFYNETGSINHEVFANGMEHYDMLGFTLFEKPEYTIYTDQTDLPWQINADEGTLYDDERIELEQNVQIRSLNQQDFVQIITTSYVEIDLVTKTAYSDQPVQILGNDFVITGNGFKVNLLTRKLELSDHVETVYQPGNLPQ